MLIGALFLGAFFVAYMLLSHIYRCPRRRDLDALRIQLRDARWRLATAIVQQTSPGKAAGATKVEE